MNGRVLLTGGSGFLGTHCLIALAARGWAKVYPLLSAHCDLFDPDAVEKLLTYVRPTHLLHLAWDTTPGSYWTSPENQRWLEASVRLLEQFAAAGGKRFVGAGTCAEYEWLGGACSETHTPLRPVTPYGSAKNALRESIERLAPGLGVSAAWGRIFFPYGPGEHPERLVAYVIRSLLAGQPARCTSGEQRRDYIYAGDVADAFATLLESDVTGAVNIGSGDAVTVKSMITAVGEKIGRPELIRFGERPLPAGEPDELYADMSRMQAELGWRPRTTLDEGIATAIDFWRQA